MKPAVQSSKSPKPSPASQVQSPKSGESSPKALVQIPESTNQTRQNSCKPNGSETLFYQYSHFVHRFFDFGLWTFDFGLRPQAGRLWTRDSGLGRFSKGLSRL